MNRNLEEPRGGESGDRTHAALSEWWLGTGNSEGQNAASTVTFAIIIASAPDSDPYTAFPSL